MPTLRRHSALALLLGAVSCAGGGPAPAGSPTPVPGPARAGPPAAVAGPAQVPEPREHTVVRPRPVAPPELARALGLMPLASTGVPEFRVAHPTFDGRGVLIAILDSGIDLGVLGLQSTTTGAAKVLDLRDVSGEGDVALEPVTADAAGHVTLPGGLALAGAAAVRAVAADGQWFGGVLEELTFGGAPAADFNGNGLDRDRYGIVVVRGDAGWLVFVDSNGNLTLNDERPLADFLVRRETFTFARRFGARVSGPITAAVNVGDDPARPGRPKLAIHLDTSGHGTHVAGIAAGHGLYGVTGLDGVAPGAQLLGVKLSDNARGGVTTNGSLLRALNYAARFAAERGLPLVINLSFGVGNEVEGGAAVDSLVDEFLVGHPDVVFTVSAGNDGPGTSTMGFPASAELALAAGAVYPGAFARVQFGIEWRDVLGWWGARGGELNKPDLVFPGMAYSAVPAWNVGEEIKLGTSMAAPYAAGLAALLVSAGVQEGRAPSAAQVIQALRASARRFEGESQIDQGYGMPQIEAAYRRLAAGGDVPRLRVQALAAPSVTPPGLRPSAGDVAGTGRGPRRTAAYRRDGLSSPADTVQRFRITALPASAGGSRAPAAGQAFQLVSGAAWVRTTVPTVTLDANGAAVVEVRYDAAQLARPGRYVGTVFGYPVADSSGGPVFALANTVVVSDTSSVLNAVGRKQPAGTTARYFLRVPEGASALAIRASLRDSAAQAAVNLYEPSGRPSRVAEKFGLGGGDAPRESVLIPSNDVVPGVWELVVQVPPGREARYDLRAVVPGARVTVVDSASSRPHLAFSSDRDTNLLVAADQIGMTRLREVSILGGATWRDTVQAPAWARKAVFEVWMPREAWDEVTDFSLTLYDGTGTQLENGAMNYAYHRIVAGLPSNRAEQYVVVAEMFPGFAREQPPARFDVRTRVTFLGAPHPLQVALEGGPAPLAVDTATLRIPARGVGSVIVSGLRPLARAGWNEWVRVRAFGSRGDWVMIEREFPVPAAQ